MSSQGIEAIGASGLSGLQLPSTPTVGGTDTTLSAGTSTDAAQGPTGPEGPTGDFGNLLIKSLDSVEAMGDKASDLSVQAATGDLDAIHDYTIAATEAQVATQLTVAVRNKAVDAFNEIMRMSV
jgi:flagellar hook-basal body complex protein FliE